MIELDSYDIEPLADNIQTAAVPKPTAESKPLEIFEMDRVLWPFDRGVLFSGGDDPLAHTHWLVRVSPNLFEPRVARYT